MKRLIFIIFIFNISNIAFSQEKKDFRPEFRLGILFGNAGSVGTVYEYSSGGGLRMSYIRGMEMKMVFPTRYRHLSVISGASVLDSPDGGYGSYPAGTNETGSLLIGSLYAGSQLSSLNRILNIDAIMAAGVFNVQDELFTSKENQIIFSSVSNYTALGVKCGLNLRISLGNVSLNSGAGLFTTAGKESFLLFKTIDFSMGYTFR